MIQYELTYLILLHAIFFQPSVTQYDIDTLNLVISKSVNTFERE